MSQGHAAYPYPDPYYRSIFAPYDAQPYSAQPYPAQPMVCYFFLLHIFFFGASLLNIYESLKIWELALTVECKILVFFLFIHSQRGAHFS